MPKVFGYTVGDATVSSVADRLEVMVTLNIDGMPATKTLKVHVSYKKHLLSSYIQTDDIYKPTPAAINTLALIDEGVFRVAFTQYATHLAKKLVEHGKTEDFKPSAQKFTSTKGVAFGNDDNHLGAEVHCFPVAEGSGALAVSLDKPTFEAFIAVMHFMFMAKPSNNDFQKALAGWPAVKPKVEANQLLTGMQIASLKIKLNRWNTDTAEAIDRQRLVGETQSRVEKIDPSAVARTMQGGLIQWKNDNGSWKAVEKVASQVVDDDEGGGFSIFD